MAVGEGEAIMLEIMDRVAAGGPMDDIEGTCLMTGEGYKANPRRPYIKDLDSIPHPARHLLPMEAYFDGYLEGAFYAMRKRIATMITSRGCPGKCIYCAVKTVWGRRWRGRSPVDVVDEIEALMRDYDVGRDQFPGRQHLGQEGPADGHLRRDHPPQAERALDHAQRHRPVVPGQTPHPAH